MLYIKKFANVLALTPAFIRCNSDQERFSYMLFLFYLSESLTSTLNDFAGILKTWYHSFSDLTFISFDGKSLTIAVNDFLGLISIEVICGTLWYFLLQRWLFMEWYGTKVKRTPYLILILMNVCSWPWSMTGEQNGPVTAKTPRTKNSRLVSSRYGIVDLIPINIFLSSLLWGILGNSV